jgi:hypothetical protein
MVPGNEFAPLPKHLRSMRMAHLMRLRIGQVVVG